MGTLDIHQIREILPHRYPFLLIDKVTSYEPYKFIIAVKNVSVNEPFFQGHFPVKPIMPGVLIIEAMAQAAALLGCVSTAEVDRKGHLYYLVGVDQVRFKRPVEPGDHRRHHRPGTRPIRAQRNRSWAVARDRRRDRLCTGHSAFPMARGTHTYVGATDGHLPRTDCPP